MINKIKKIILFGLIIIILTGCTTDNNKPSLSELSKINDKIIAYFQSSNVEYTNYSYNYVDEANRQIVVGLLNNSKEEQDKFKELVVNSEYITFRKGEPNYNY